MRAVGEYEASDKSKGMTAEEIRLALADAEAHGTILTIMSRNTFSGRVRKLIIETTLGRDDAVQA